MYVHGSTEIPHIKDKDTADFVKAQVATLDRLKKAFDHATRVFDRMETYETAHVLAQADMAFHQAEKRMDKLISSIARGGKYKLS